MQHPQIQSSVDQCQHPIVWGVFLLNATLQYHLNQQATSYPELVERLTKSTFVDDIVCGAQSEQQAYQLYLDSKEVLRRGGFNLRKFVSNSGLLQARINGQGGMPEPQNTPSCVSQSDETYTKATLGTAQPVQSGEQKILGVHHSGESQDTNLVSVTAYIVHPQEPQDVSVLLP